MLQYSLACLLCLFFWGNAAAQSGTTQLRTLKDKGVLLIALPTRSNKVAAIHKQLARPDLTAEQRTNWEARLARVAEDNARDARLLQQAFAAAYSFSDYRFTNDTVAVQMRSGAEPAYLLDDMLATVSTDWPTNKPYWIVQYATRNGMKGLQVRTADLQPIPTDVEDFYRLNGIGSFFRALTKPKAEAELIDAQKMVERLDARFRRSQRGLPE